MKTCQQAAINYNKRLLEGLRLTHQVQQYRGFETAALQACIVFGVACSKARHCYKLRRSCPTWSCRGCKMTGAHAVTLAYTQCIWLNCTGTDPITEEGLQLVPDPRVACWNLCGADAHT